MSLFSFLKESSLTDHLKTTLPITVFVNLVGLFIYKRVSRFLKARSLLSYALFRSLYLGCLLFGWGFLLVSVLSNAVEGWWGSKIVLSPDLQWLNFGFFSIFFTATLIRTSKKLVLGEKFLEDRVASGTVRRVAFLLQTFLLLWFGFLIRSAFVVCANDYNRTIRNVLIVTSTLCLTVLAACGLKIFTNYYIKELEKTDNVFIGICLKATSTPVILLLVGTILLYVVRHYTTQAVREAIGKHHYGYIVPVLMFIIFRFISLLEKQLVVGKWSEIVPNKTVVQGMCNIARAVLVIPGLFMLWNLFFGDGMKITGIGTALGGTGLGLAFAARPIVANYLSGLVVSFQGNFKVGDWIYFTDGKVEGTIEQIGAVSTAIRTFDKRLLFLPNSAFSSKSIVNASAMTHRRILQRIPVGWVTSTQVLDKIIQEIRMLVYNHPGIDKTQRLMVHLTSFGKMGMEITIYAFAKTKDWHTYLNVQENILRETKTIIENHSGALPAHIPYTPVSSS